jgi:hypothetical protein
MDRHGLALAAAGLVGCAVAVVHGVLTQRLMVRPLLASRDFRRGMKPMAAALLQFSTYNWFLGGLALLAAAAWFGWEARLATGLLAGSSYLAGGVGNLWASRGRHPGGFLYVAAVLLIAYGVLPPGR